MRAPPGRPQGRHHEYGAAQRRTTVTPSSWEGVVGKVVP